MGALGLGIFGYHIQDGQLKILRLGWSKDINLSEIESVEFKPHAMTGSVRTFGIGGMFGYFRNSILKVTKRMLPIGIKR
ncbi:PH domain-containing protein [Fodinibius sp. AD559]|uniref:PH domain-containing protein n=1 Tax=Fodinibius sp. AD559 TaxID=3424179 RepID=UPI004046F84A